MMQDTYDELARNATMQTNAMVDAGISVASRLANNPAILINSAVIAGKLRDELMDNGFTREEAVNLISAFLSVLRKS